MHQLLTAALADTSWHDRSAAAPQAPLLLYACAFRDLTFRRSAENHADVDKVMSGMLGQHLVGAGLVTTVRQRLLADMVGAAELDARCSSPDGVVQRAEPVATEAALDAKEPCRTAQGMGNGLDHGSAPSQFSDASAVAGPQAWARTVSTLQQKYSPAHVPLLERPRDPPLEEKLARYGRVPKPPPAPDVDEFAPYAEQLWAREQGDDDLAE